MSSENCQETIKKLEEKNSELKGILNEVLSEPKGIGKIAAGSFVMDGQTYYRVSTGTESKIMGLAPEFFFKNPPHGDIPTGTEVALIGNAIAGIIPAELEKEVKEKPTFKLITWEHIGGLKSQVERIRETVETSFKNEKLAKEFGVEPTKGILLYGSPGCGKTLIAKAIASEILGTQTANEDSFVYIKGAELLSKFVGETEQTIRDIFKKCRKYSASTGKRALIFIDEAEAILGKRGTGISSDVQDTIVPSFLSEMDGFDDNSPVMLLATNLPERIDPAILRDGRIDLKVRIDRPNLDDAKEIFQIHLGRVKVLDSVEALSEVAAEQLFSCSMVSNVSGAMIENIVNGAAKKAMLRKIANKTVKAGIVEQDILDSITNLNMN